MFNGFLIFYLALCLLFLLYWFLKENRGIVTTVSRFSIVLFFPVLGIVYLLLVDYLEKKIRVNRLDELQNIFTIDKQSLGIHRRVNWEKEMNIVPLEESLLINNAQTKRRLLLDALKEDSLQRISLMEMALKDEDTETSHYAAAALAEVQRKLLLDLQQLESKAEADPFNIAVLIPYAEVLKRFLSISLLDPRTYRRFFHVYSAVLSSLLEVYREEERYFVDKINCELKNENFQEVLRYCEMFNRAFPNSETPYVMKLKLYFEIKNTESFNQTLKELKSSAIKLSNEGLKMVRFWGDGAG